MQLKKTKTQQLDLVKFAFNEVMPLIKGVTCQPDFGFHGLTHTEQVVLFGIDYVLSLGEKPLPVILACALHDCARKNDSYDETHGPACVPIVQAFLQQHSFSLSPDEKAKITQAVAQHTVGQNASDYICACLWDADRTRLSWLKGYDERFFSTIRAKQVASLSAQQINVYEKEQLFLLKQTKVSSFMLKEAEEREHLYVKMLVKNLMVR